jgi:GPH family glycoside/pentoside/hexuronide:cation symporter
MSAVTGEKPLSRLVKLVYGSGEWSYASFGTLRQIFYAIFLTDVVGIDARLASFAALIGIIWDAINDPLVGVLSDRVNTRWGRRRPFLLYFSIPFGLGFLALWWAPPWESQAALFITVMLAYMLSDTFQTLVSVPYASLTPEIAPDYDERTSVTGYRMFFNLLASLVTAVVAPMVVKGSLAAGGTLQQGYITVAMMFGGLAVIPWLLIFAVVRERPRTVAQKAEVISFRESVRSAWANIPFRFATGIYMLNWITFDLVALMLPFFLTYWVAQGNLIASLNILGDTMAIESVVLGLLLITAVVSLPFWTWLARKLSKRIAYITAMSFWAAVQLVILAVRPGQVTFVLALAVLAGISVGAAHALPDAIFPDVLEWDELLTRKRREGIYYGVKNFVRKLAGAVAIFLALQVLGWFGYQNPPSGITQFAQPDSALGAIRIMAGPMGTVLLCCAIAVAWFYPITRDRHARIRRLLARRKERGE